MKLFAALTALSASLVMTGAALSQSDDTDETPFVPEGYELTGETRSCLSRSAARPFTYISYTVPGAQLCRGEIVRVMDQGTNTVVGSCGIGEFEKLSPLPEDAS